MNIVVQRARGSWVSWGVCRDLCSADEADGAVGDEGTVGVETDFCDATVFELCTPDDVLDEPCERGCGRSCSHFSCELGDEVYFWDEPGGHASFDEYCDDSRDGGIEVNARW